MKNTISDLNLADNSSTSVKGKGDIRIVKSRNASDIVTLKDALLVPDIHTNLISIAKIVDKNHEVLFTKDRAVVKDKNGDTKLTATRIGDLFYLRGKSELCAAVETKNHSDEAASWHARLGHLNSRDMQLMSRSNCVTGFKYDGTAESSKCETCEIFESPMKNPFKMPPIF